MLIFKIREIKSFSHAIRHLMKAYAFYQYQTQGVYGPAPVPGVLLTWVICLAFIMVTLLISWLTFRYVEVPARNFLNHKFGGRKKEYVIEIGGNAV